MQWNSLHFSACRKRPKNKFLHAGDFEKWNWISFSCEWELYKGTAHPSKKRKTLNAAEAFASAAFPFYAYNINEASGSPLPTNYCKYIFWYQRGSDHFIDRIKPRTSSTRFRDVSVDLFSRAASRQVFSALKSLTTVFGMGTGGPSS